MLTPEQVAEIKARCEAATEGPWVAKCSGHDYPYIVAGKWQLGCGEDFAKMTDATFIAAARTGIPALLSDRAELVAEIEGLEACLENEHACGISFEEKAREYKAEIERLRGWGKAIGYDLDAVEECHKTHLQNCSQCPRLECCDNISPIKELRAKIERLRAAVENHGTFRWMDMTPNDDLPRRILSAYLDYSEWTDNTAGLEPTNPLILAMNQHREQRNALIEAALAALEARDE